MLQSMRITGPTPLIGEIEISGAKNFALPALVTTLLTDEPITLTNLPNISDINFLLELLHSLGTDINRNLQTVTLTTNDITTNCATYDFVRKMRASILVLSPLVSRCGEAFVSLPGGCAIGIRSVDLHLEILRKLGANVELQNGLIHVKASKGLHGADITFSIITVTGTENAIMASVLAKGTTTLRNVAIEPEIIEFCKLLNQMGANIKWLGERTIRIDGVEKLHHVQFNIIPDRIEAGTYAIAAACTQGKILLKNCIYEHLSTFFKTLELTGINIEQKSNGILVHKKQSNIIPVDIQTSPHPGFATDLQAQYTVLMSISSGISHVTETIFENRFMHIPELIRMGAKIELNGNTAKITGVHNLNGAQVMATDLRASMSLIIAGLMANGTTIVNRLYHLDRGYEDIDNKLRKLGAKLERVNSNDLSI